MAEEGQVIACETVASFREHFQKASDAKKLVVIDFTATWCGPCRIIAPVFAENAKKFPHVVFLKVDVDELSDVAKEYEVEAMPTFLFLKEGKVIERIVGAIKGKIEEAIQKYHCETATA